MNTQTSEEHRRRDSTGESAIVDYEAQKAKASSPTDEVFGDIREGGPNYRNVSWLNHHWLMNPGRTSWSSSPHLEIANRAGCAEFARSTRDIGYCSGNPVSGGYRGHHDLVRIRYRRVEIET